MKFTGQNDAKNHHFLALFPKILNKNAIPKVRGMSAGGVNSAYKRQLFG
jgi:hypothetical protein